MMKKTMNLWLLAALVCGLSLGVTSCKDDDKNESGNVEVIKDGDDDRYSDEAIDFLTCVSLLCDVNELSENWRTDIYTPTIGVVTDETRPTVRTVYVSSREEAAIKFLSLIPTEVNPDNADMTVWQHDVLGTLSFNYDFNGTEGLLATVDVKSPRIPRLEQIRYVDNEVLADNGNYFEGPAFYQLGDVVEEKVPGIEKTVKWICVRPAHSSMKGDSHWVSLSFDTRCVYSYSSKRYTQAYIPTNLHQSDEQLTNFCQLLYFMRDPMKLRSYMVSDPDMQKGLGGLNGLYDDEYMVNLGADWDKYNLWESVLPEAMRVKMNDIMLGNTDTLSFFVNGYSSWSKYLKVYKSEANVKNKFMKVTNTSQEFRDTYVDFCPGWENGKILVMQYRKGDELQKGYKGDQPFDVSRFTSVYRYSEHHLDVSAKQPVDGHYGSFQYKTVSATGDSIVLSGMMGWPKSNVARDILIGCHVTITNNPDAPTMWTGNIKKETNLLLDHLHDKDKRGYNCLVVIPDYEGYGNTVGTPHPYLCQEVTARQVTDAVVAAKKLFLSRGGRLNDDYKAISVGFSQGGSVAMATQRYIEEHNDIKRDLHYCGAVCGDGPYDPLATFQNYFDSNKLYMPVVMPLVLISYCTYDPDMKAANCKLEDFLTEKFLASGIVRQVKEKKLHTKEIQTMLKSYVKRNPEGFHPGEDTWWYLPTTDVVKEECIDYFKNPNSYNGTNKAKFEALRNALIRNQIWGKWSNGNTWANTTKLALFHSTRDEVVPLVNYTRAIEKMGQNFHGWKYNSTTTYGHIWTGCWFYAWYEIDLVNAVLEQNTMDQQEEEIGGLLF